MIFDRPINELIGCAPTLKLRFEGRLEHYFLATSFNIYFLKLVAYIFV